MKKVFLEDLPRWRRKGNVITDNINWEASIGYKVNFIYENIKGEMVILGLKKSRHPKIEIKYNDDIFDIDIEQFKKCSIGRILGLITNNFKMEIKTRLQDGKRDLTIIDREYRVKERANNKGRKSITNQKWYKYKCNVCGWDEGWAEESPLISGRNCSCCSGRTTVEGINDIPTTAPWMIKYFQGGYDEAKLYTKTSHQKIYPICPDCGKIKGTYMKISEIYAHNSIGCNCNDGKSYSEKLMLNILEQLNIIFKTEYSPIWISPRRYDFYFEYNNEQYIIETHGLQHYEDSTGNWKRTLLEEQENDKIKKEFALSNGIKEENYIVIDCRESDLEWIKNNDNGILKSKLNDLFNLNKIDWLKAEEFACSNLIKIACNYKKNNSELTTIDIGEIMNLSQATIINYLKRGNRLGWCKYNIRSERIKSGVKISLSKFKPLICMNTENVFNSVLSCVENSMNIFNTKFTQGQISNVCLGKRKQHKGYIFKYIEDLTSEEYIKYDIENKLKELHNQELVQAC